MLLDALYLALTIGSCWVVDRQGRHRAALLQPEVGFLLHGVRLYIVLQALGPLLEAAASRLRLQRQPLLQALIGLAQVLQQDAPGDGVDHQVMTEQQQAPGLLSRQVEEHGTRQWPVLQVQAGLLLATALAHAAGLLPSGSSRKSTSVKGTGS